MEIPKGYRFEVPFDVAFPQGAAMVGEVMPDNEFQSREDMSRGKPVVQRVDEVTGKRQWKTVVTDLAPTNAKRASFEGLTAEPKLAGNGEYKYQSYAFRATGFKAAGSVAPSKSTGANKAGGAPAASEQKAA